jgi:methylmalonyl-CoA/ethylmalonyl-CoA epimerase
MANTDLFLGLSHVAIAVPNLREACELFSALFGQPIKAINENPEQGVRMALLDIGTLRIELMEPTGDSGPIARYLARHPSGGVHHISLAVADMDLALAGALAAGVKPIAPPSLNVHQRRMAFLRPDRTLGVLVELEEHDGEE